MRPISDPLSAINCTGAPPPAMPSTFTRRSTSGRVATPNMRVTRVMWTKTTRRRRSRSWTLSATNVGTTSGTTDAQDGTEKDFPLLKPNFSVVSFKYTHDIYPNYCLYGTSFDLRTFFCKQVTASREVVLSDKVTDLQSYRLTKVPMNVFFLNIKSQQMQFWDKRVGFCDLYWCDSFSIKGRWSCGCQILPTLVDADVYVDGEYVWILT